MASRAAARAAAWVARASMRAWFRTIEVEGMHRLPSQGPVLVTASHLNGVVDAALLVSTVDRQLWFLAKSGLWKVKPLGRLLDAIGVLPVQRPTDRVPVDNRATFAATHRVLGDGGAVVIFPEGTTHSDARLRELRTGAARIALGARSAGVAGIVVVPVGILYEAKSRFRARSLVRVGSPLRVDEWMAATGRSDVDDADRPAVAALTDEIDARLRAAAVDFADADEALVLMRAARISLGHDGEVALGRVEPVARALADAPEPDRRAIAERLAAYELRLRLTGLDDHDVPGGVVPRRPRLGRHVAMVVIGGPPAAVGVAANALPAWAVRRFTDTPMAPHSRAGTTLLAALVAFPLTWVGLGWILHRRRIPFAWLTALVVGPACGAVAIVVGEDLAELRRARLSWRRVIHRADVLDDLRAHRAAVADAVRATLGASAGAARGSR